MARDTYYDDANELGPRYTIIVWTFEVGAAPARVMIGFNKRAAKNAMRRIWRVAGVSRAELSAFDLDWAAGSEPQTLINWQRKR